IPRRTPAARAAALQTSTTLRASTAAGSCGDSSASASPATTDQSGHQTTRTLMAEPSWQDPGTPGRRRPAPAYGELGTALHQPAGPPTGAVPRDPFEAQPRLA